MPVFSKDECMDCVGSILEQLVVERFLMRLSTLVDKSFWLFVYYYTHWTMLHIAKLTGVSKGAVSAGIKRVLKILRPILLGLSVSAYDKHV